MNASSQTAVRDVRYEPNEQPPPLLSLGLGFQCVLLTIGDIVLMVAIVIRAAGTGEAYLNWAVFAALCVSGLSTILQAVRLGRFGAGYILQMGTAGVFIAASVTALAEGGPGLLATLIVASSLFQFVLSSRLSWLRRLITPVVTGTVIMLIAVAIMPIVFDMLAKVPEGSPRASAPASAVATLICTVGLTLLARGAWRLWAPMVGIVAGCVVASWYGLYDTGRIGEAPWIGWPASAWPGLDVRFDSAFWTLLPVFMIVTLVGAVKTIGDTIGIQQVSWRRPRATDFRAVQRAVAADGVGNFLSGLAGTAPNTTYSPSVAVVELTGVAARSVGVCIGVLFVMIAFLPKATAALLAVPEPVIAAYATVLTAMLFVGGMRMVVQDGVDYRESLVVGLAFWLGVGFQNQAIFADYLGGAVGSIFGNGMTAGGLTAILMTLVMGLVARRRKMAAKLHVESLSKIDEFLRRFARDKRWHQAATERLCAVAEEAILSLVPDEDASTVEEARHLLLVVRGDSRAAELEFIASEVEQNIEDRLALLGPWAEETGGREFSLRLLRHYASRVRHQQYYDVDILTVRVEGDGAGRA